MGKIKAYLYVVLGGLVILAAGVLVLLQWNGAARFQLYGLYFDITVVDGQITGGVNTALLMLCSAVGGVVMVFVVRLFFRGVGILRRASKADAGAQAAVRKELAAQQKGTKPEAGPGDDL